MIGICLLNMIPKREEEIVHMTVFEAIDLMFAFGVFIIALLSYINRK